VGKPVGNRPLGSPRHRWESNIKMVLLEVGWEQRLDCSGSEKVHEAGSCRGGNEHSGFIICQEFLDYLRTC